MSLTFYAAAKGKGPPLTSSLPSANMILAYRVGVWRLPYHSAITLAEVANTLCLLGSASAQLKLATHCRLE